MRSSTPQLRQSKSTSKLNPISKYIKGKQLGKGGFAKCYEFTQITTGKVLAGKVIQKATLTRAKAKQKLVSEIQIHRSIKHEHIVTFDSSFEDAECYYIMMELCPNQTLNELVRRRRRLCQIEVQCFLYQLARGLEYLHLNKVIHRDLKLSNLFLSEKLEIKMGDLGLAAKLGAVGERRRTVCGTPNYIAPEILDGVGHSYEVDLWSFGVIAYALLVGRLPFENKENNVNITYNKIRMCNYSFPEEVTISRSAKNFIAKLLQIDPAKRMTFEEIYSHDFMTSTPFPKTLPLSSLAQPPTPHFLKQFTPAIASQQPQQQSKPSRQSSKEVFGVRRNSSTDRNPYLQARVSATDVIGRVQKEQVQAIQSKLPRPSSTTLLSKWKNLVGKQDKEKQTQKVSSFYQKKPAVNHIEQWVINFIQNPKYGTCYSLNSGAIGMMFVDNTCLISDAAHLKLKYLQLSKQSSLSPLTFPINSHQPFLSKKIKIFQHFKKQLSKQKQQNDKRMTTDQLIRVTKQRSSKQTKLNCMNIFVKRSGSKNSFKYFLLSNNVLQGVFKDGSQMLISKGNNLYINKYGEQMVFNGGEEVSGETRKQFEFLMGMLKNSKAGGEILRKEGENENENVDNINKSSSLAKKEISTSTNDSKENSLRDRKISVTLSRSKR